MALWGQASDSFIYNHSETVSETSTQLCMELHRRHKLCWVSCGKSNPIRNTSKFKSTVFILSLNHDDVLFWDFLGD